MGLLLLQKLMEEDKKYFNAADRTANGKLDKVCTPASLWNVAWTRWIDRWSSAPSKTRSTTTTCTRRWWS